MPTIAFKTRIRTVSDNCTLDLVVSHRLMAREPSAAPRVVKNPPPKDLVIVLVSPLTITTSGMLNNRRISAEGLMTSRIAKHLLEYLKLNSSELGFEAVSDAHIAKDSGLLTFFCTASRPSWPLEVPLPHLQLLGFHMDYSWHETPPLSSPEGSGLLDSVLTPFSSRLTLPYITTLNNTVERFVKFQMVKRYPRIFGSWIQQLEMEKPLISSMFTSLRNILRRSSNPAFQESCRSLLKMLEKATFTSLADSENRLSSYLESGSLDTDNCRHALLGDDETVFTHAMEQIYCLAMKRRIFKSISTPQNWLRPSEDIFCDQQPLLVGFEEEPHSGASDEDDLNMCFGQYGGIADVTACAISAPLAEDLFACDSDPTEAQLGIAQFLTPSELERFSPDFSPILGSLPANFDPDSLTAAQCLENVDTFVAKVSTPDFVSGLGSRASSCAESYLSESQIERSTSNALAAPSHDFSFSQDIFDFTLVTEGQCDRNCADSPLISRSIHPQGLRQVMEGINPPSSAQFALADTVSEWVSSFDFVAMEF